MFFGCKKNKDYLI